tara:strand:+ start:91 stop:567 length:477 start_codon:yes stop_codon:yes gene_type:complete
MKYKNTLLSLILALVLYSCNSTNPLNVKKSETQTITSIKYGYIISSIPVEIKGEGSAIGTTAGAMIGGLLATQICGTEEIAGTACEDIAIVYGTIGGAALGYVSEAMLGNHDGFQYVINLENESNDIAVVQGDEQPLQNGQKVIVMYSDTIRVLPFND